MFLSKLAKTADFCNFSPLFCKPKITIYKKTCLITYFLQKIFGHIKKKQ